MFTQITMNIFWINLLLCIQFAFHEAYKNFPCGDDHICPADKPFCTDDGCVFDCPEPFKINGSTCVPSCGDLFVVQRFCKQSCPLNWYIKEKPKVIGLKIIIDKICISSCDLDEYIWNGSCVRLCPVKYNFIDSNSCLENCPSNKPYQLNFSSNSLDFHRCFQTCPILSVGFYCTDQCSSDMFEFNSTCVPSCPISHPLKLGQLCSKLCSDPYIYHENNTCYKNCPKQKPYFYPDNQICSKTCPDNFYLSSRQGILNCELHCRQNEFVYQRSCVTSCSSVEGKVLYQLKTTCVDRCPTGTYLSNYFADDYGYCTEMCPEYTYVRNSSCVASCPYDTYLSNSSCLEECPINSPYYCDVNLVKTCDSALCSNTEKPIQKLCVDKCPYYRDQNVCVQICPTSKYVFGDICTTMCPPKQPLVQVVQYDFQTCRASYMAWEGFVEGQETEYRNTCVSKCQDGLVIFNSTCQKSCPDDYRFLVNGTCQEEKCNNLMYETSDFNICIDECKDNEFILNNSCVKLCPKGFYTTNKTCHIERCQTKYSYTLDDVTFCVNNCAPFRFILNSTCTDNCLHFAFNNVCVNYCPETHHITLNQTSLDSRTSFIQCVDKCPDTLLLFNASCVKHCQEGTVQFNGTCLSSCPASNNLKTMRGESKNIYCVDRCSDQYPLLDVLNLTCVDTCPQTAQYIHLNKCKESCPNEQYKYRSKQGFVCSNDCPVGKLLYNFSCYDSCPENLYDFNGVKCVQKCPSELPLGLKSQKWVCISACDSLKVFKDGNCIYQSECTEPFFIDDDQCIDNCPEHYLWFAAECINIYRGIVIPGLVCLSIFIILLCCTKTVIKEYLLVFGMVFFRIDVRFNLEEEEKEKRKMKKENQTEQTEQTQHLLLREDNDDLSETTTQS